MRQNLNASSLASSPELLGGGLLPAEGGGLLKLARETGKYEASMALERKGFKVITSSIEPVDKSTNSKAMVEITEDLDKVHVGEKRKSKGTLHSAAEWHQQIGFGAARPFCTSLDLWFGSQNVDIDQNPIM